MSRSYGSRPPAFGSLSVRERLPCRGRPHRGLLIVGIRFLLSFPPVDPRGLAAALDVREELRVGWPRRGARLAGGGGIWLDSRAGPADRGGPTQGGPRSDSSRPSGWRGVLCQRQGIGPVPPQAMPKAFRVTESGGTLRLRGDRNSGGASLVSPDGGGMRTGRADSRGQAGAFRGYLDPSTAIHGFPAGAESPLHPGSPAHPKTFVRRRPKVQGGTWARNSRARFAGKGPSGSPIAVSMLRPGSESGCSLLDDGWCDPALARQGIDVRW